MIILGLNSGTSRDGISGVIFRLVGLFPRARVKVIFNREFPYPQKVLELIEQVEKKPDLESISRLHFLLGEIFAKTALKLIDCCGLSPGKIDLIASHGQTLAHFPERKKLAGYKISASFQLGEPSVIAQRTGITTVGNFRAGDIAGGGEGAPILAYSEFLLFGSGNKSRMILNLGGIANFTLISKRAKPEQIRAMDAGVCNIFLDQLVQILTEDKLRFDRNGKIAQKGKVRPKWKEHFLKHLLFRPGKSRSLCARHYQREWIKKVLSPLKISGERARADLLRSGVRAVAEMIYLTYSANFKNNLIDELVISGGGAKNQALILEIKEVFKKKVILSSELGIPLQAKEPIGFGILAQLCLQAKEVDLSSITGAKFPSVLGQIAPGKNWKKLLKKLTKGAKQ